MRRSNGGARPATRPCAAPAFQEAISHLGKAIEMADKVGEGPTASVAAPSQRLKLQTNYGQALIYGKGYAAPETVAAFARARDLLATRSDASDPFELIMANGPGASCAATMRSAKQLRRHSCAKRKAYRGHSKRLPPVAC